MSTPDPDFDWDLKAVLEHHAADVLRQFAHDLYAGHPDSEVITLGEVRDLARTQAERLDGCTHRLNDGDLTCNQHGPHPTHTYAASDAADRHTTTEARHD